MVEIYTVVQKGREWAIYCKTSGTIVQYGKKRADLQRRADKLNKEASR